MARYVLVAMNGPTPDGDAAALEHWYESVHIADLKTCEGIKAARRFEVVKGVIPGKDLWPNIAIYEIEADNLDDVSKEMQAKCRPFHPDFDRSRSGHIFAIQTAGDPFID